MATILNYITYILDRRQGSVVYTMYIYIGIVCTYNIFFIYVLHVPT